MRLSPTFLPPSSLLVGLRADLAPTRAVRDKTGCRGCGRSASWAWFFCLWAGSSAPLHFSLQSPPKPCHAELLLTLGAKSLRRAMKPPRCLGEEDPVRATVSARASGGSFTAIQAGRSLPHSGRGWLSAAERTSERGPPPPPALVRKHSGRGLAA